MADNEWESLEILERDVCKAVADNHIYSKTGDYLMANERFVALYCITAGEKRINLPQTCRVEDALGGELVTQAADEIRFTARAGETRSFVLEPVV